MTARTNLDGELMAARSRNMALDRLYRLYRDQVRRYIARTFGAGPPDPDDVVQAVFENFAALEDAGQIKNPPAFLIRSAHNYVLDQRRREAVRASHRQDAGHLASETDDLDAERVLSAKDRLALLNRVIQAMEPRRREWLILNRIHGLSFAEISRRKGVSQTLVKNVVGQALMLCEQALREAEGE